MLHEDGAVVGGAVVVVVVVVVAVLVVVKATHEPAPSQFPVLAPRKQDVPLAALLKEPVAVAGVQTVQLLVGDTWPDV